MNGLSGKTIGLAVWVQAWMVSSVADAFAAVVDIAIETRTDENAYDK